MSNHLVMKNWNEGNLICWEAHLVMKNNLFSNEKYL